MWTAKEIPSQEGRNVIVTGANTGIGYETALALYLAGANVTLACRSQDKAEQASAKITQQSDAGSAEIGVLDLEDLDSVRLFAETYIRQHYDTVREYSQNKLADLMFTIELDRRARARGDQVVSIAAQPGANNTDLTRHSSAEDVAAMKDRFGGFMDPWQGALPSLYAAVSSEATGGNLYEPHEGGFKGYPVKSDIRPVALDEAVAKKLWNVAEEATGVMYPA